MCPLKRDLSWKLIRIDLLRLCVGEVCFLPVADVGGESLWDMLAVQVLV